MMLTDRLLRLISAFMTAVLLLLSAVAQLRFNPDGLSFSVDASVGGEAIGNVTDTVNVWSLGAIGQDFSLGSESADCSEFVDYVQIMQATGGNVDRDLFVEPENFEELFDYDFSSLITACERILAAGAKPWIKTGNVPLKYSRSRTDVIGGFEVNVYPPDDYDIYYSYLAACFTSLVDVFGRDEVLSWRFGVFTEYENGDWFYDTDENGNPGAQESLEAFCRIYDVTVAALQNSVGEDVFVGAHSVTVTEGLWDERGFIEHVAKGENYYTHEIGTRICYLAFSFYDTKPGKFTYGLTIEESVDFLRKKAESVGLDNLIYGVDEGRLLFGANSGTVSDALLMRICGYTWQAAYDARLYKKAVDSGISYISSWGYNANGLSGGSATVSFHTARLFSQFSGMNRLKTAKAGIGVCDGLWKCLITDKNKLTDIDILAAKSEDGKTIQLMAYNFKNDLKYSGERNAKFTVFVPELDENEVTVKISTINDECNYFDDWVTDREVFGITAEDSIWSPDDPALGSGMTLSTQRGRDAFNALKDKYELCSVLEPEIFTAKVIDGALQLNTRLDPSTVVFIEITAE